MTPESRGVTKFTLFLMVGSLHLTQDKYIKDIEVKTSMQDVKSISSLMVAGCKLSKHGSDFFGDPTLYCSSVGAIQYLTINDELKTHCTERYPGKRSVVCVHHMVSR